MSIDQIDKLIDAASTMQAKDDIIKRTKYITDFLDEN